MRYEYFIGFRYLKAQRKQTMISIITFISIFGVALGVAALIIVLAVMTGFEEDLREKILGTNAHIVIVPNSYDDHITDYPEIETKIRSEKEIKEVDVFIYSKVMINHFRRSDGIVLKGIQVDQNNAHDLKNYIKEGSFDDLIKSPDETDTNGDPILRDGILLGLELGSYLGCKVGDTVSLTSSGETLTPFGMIPKAKAFRVAGFFQTGMFEYDRSMAYISLPAAQKLFNISEGINGFEIRVKDIFATHKIVASLRDLLGARFWTRDWKEMNQTFFAALKLEKIAMFIILTLIVFVASFNIISSLTMMVMEKHKDIGILKAMGATDRSVRLIFLTEGVIIGVVGTVLGCLVGTAVSWVADTYQLIRLQGEVYYIEYLPFRVQLMDVIAICSASLLISFIATIYPARQAAQLDPVESIRYE
jgi:lipoprotein-releasing system permease protein